MKIWYRVTITFTMLLVIFALLITGFQLAVYGDSHYGFYKKEYEKYRVTDNLNMKIDNVMAVTEHMMAYLIGKEEKAAELEKRLCCGERSRKLLRDAGHYSIQIYEKDFEKLEAAGYLNILDSEIAVLRDHEQYTEDRGMRMDVDFGEAVFF